MLQTVEKCLKNVYKKIVFIYIFNKQREKMWSNKIYKKMMFTYENGRWGLTI